MVMALPAECQAVLDGVRPPGEPGLKRKAGRHVRPFRAIQRVRASL